MAEALGVASSVAGIVSLAIDVTQGLLKYYGSWKHQDEDISDMHASLDSLCRTLTALSKTIQPPAKFRLSVKENVEENVKTVNEIVKKLQDELTNVQSLESPKLGARSALRRHVRKMLYPFKEETLKKIKGLVSEARSNLDTALQILQVDAISDIHHNAHQLVRWRKDEETQSVLHWLSSVNFWLKQADVSSIRQTGTGEWLLNKSDFLDWEIGNKSTIWCLGGPGVGKTVLASAVIEFLESDLSSRDIGLAFIYCDHKNSLLQKIDYFVGAIVRQLVERRPAISEDVRNLWIKNRGKGIAPTREEYLTLIRSLTKEYSEVYIVIDALDECIDKDGNIVWNTLIMELKDSVPNLHLLCTSRHIDDLTGILSGSTCIEIFATEADIRIYVQAQVKSKTILFQFCQQDSSLLNDILQVIILKADGMFLAVKLYVDLLASGHNLRAVRKALRALPTTLDKNYDEAIERVKRHPHRVLAMQALTWVVYAVRPLQLEEVQHAIAVNELEPDDQFVPKDILTPIGIIVNACAGILKVDEESNVIGLVHKTTQEYFDRSGTKHFPHAQRDIGIACLKYLSLDVFSDGHCHNDEQYECRLRENILLEYAAQNLADHIREEKDCSLQDLAVMFLLDNQKVSCAAQVWHVQEIFASKHLQNSNYSQSFPKDFHGVHYATFFELVEIVKLLLKHGGVDIDTKDSFGQTPLSLAAKKGYLEVVKLLLENGGDANSRNYFSWTPVSWATWGGHLEVLKLLLDHGGDANSKDNEGWTPVWSAVHKGRFEVIKLLLEKGGDANSKDSSGRTPVWWATEGGHLEVLKLLLDHGGDANSKDNLGRTPVWWAAERRELEVVKLLIESGGDVNSKDNYSWTLASWAAEVEYLELVKLLKAYSTV